ncbi:UNVERIFIED_CONTAM: Transposon Tf2-12 polyprotein [Sesamum radiatum]|uniref:Transposon Tf2-12 polyprotein n=1 Tax=Sesamum radiatum TaxID=300843 RepID=A0AAW2NPN8_SESRA
MLITGLHPLISSDSPIPKDQYSNMHGAFSKKAYHLLAKSEYDFSAPSRLNKLNPELTGEKIHGLTKAQHKLRKQGFHVDQSRLGLGFIPDEPIKIRTRKEAKYATVQYISTDKGKSDENQKPNDNRIFVFKRLGNPTPCASAFERRGGASEDTSSNTRRRQQGSVFDRLGKGHAQQLRKKGRYDEINEHIKNDISKTLHLSRPQGSKSSLLIVSSGGPIKVKQHVVGKPHDSSEIFNEEEIEIIVGSNHVSIDEGSDSDVSKDEIQNAPPELEDGVQATVDELRELNLGTTEEPRPIFVSALLSPEEEEQYFKTLGEYRDVFAWTYKEMPGLDPKVAIHHLGIRHGARPVKQSQREVKYPTWISSIVPVKKKNGQIRICVDFRDLNKACPKDDFPLPIIELMVDATTGHEALSFMDGSSGYNQIRMSPKDEECTAFRTPKGIYCYKVMPFGLKNAGATYQSAMQNIFDDMLHKNVECYVDDLVVKTKKREEHLADLQIVFDRLRKHNLKMNPLKCAFGVFSEKFLGFIVRHHGIEVDPAKVDAIQKMPPPRNLKELRSLQGNLAFIRRFISNLGGRCQPFNHLMKKDGPFQWDEGCQNAFESIKRHLLNPPVLGAPTLGKPLILYIAAQERSIGALMAQENEEGKEKALYYLSKTLTENELKPVLSGRLAKWSIVFNQYEIEYVPQKAIKGQALANFLADHPMPAEWEISDDFPDEDVFSIEILPAWTMFFAGAARTDGAGAGVVFVSPEKQVLTYSIVLNELCSNNVTEYQALIIGLQMASEMGIIEMEVYGDSKLIINQLLNIYEVKKEDLVPFFRQASHLLKSFASVTLNHIPRKENRMADALANLATTLALSEGETTNIPVCNRWVLPSLDIFDHEDSNAIMIATNNEEDWRTPLIEYLKHGKLPDDTRHNTEVRRRSSCFILYRDTLYRQSFEGTYQHCLSSEEVLEAMTEAHSGVCGAHQSGPKLHFRIKRMGYYWPTMPRIAWSMQKNASLANYTPTSFTNHQNLYILRWPHSRFMHGDSMSWGPSLLSHLPDTSIYLQLPTIFEVG